MLMHDFGRWLGSTPQFGVMGAAKLILKEIEMLLEIEYVKA